MDFSEEFVILVDQNDHEVGQMEKFAAHEGGRLHRAFSVCVFNSRQELLLQQRAWGKYHSAGLWTNTCCSHPRPGESLENAVHRRLQEEMGFDCEMQEIFHMQYRLPFSNGLTEHEYDHVFIGISDQLPKPNQDEVAGWQYMTLPEISSTLEDHSILFTDWFQLMFDQFKGDLDLLEATSAIAI
jgi:isopentenyl-diphosphate delta-isomerase